MIRFGPAGASDSFRAQGLAHSWQAPAWLAVQGLSAFEYPCGRGVTIGEASARKIGDEAQSHGIPVSLHAPYYINLAQPDEEKFSQTLSWLTQSLDAVRHMGGRRIVFHPGSPLKQKRTDAMARAMDNMHRALPLLDGTDCLFCPETMGKVNQLGTVDEIIDLCAMDARIIPTIDFAHIHALGRGAIQGIDDYRRILDPMLETLGADKMLHFHAHFSHIEYTGAGEKRHRNFDEEGFGPDFRPLATLLHEYGLAPTIICESAGHQAEDALAMQRIYEEEA